MLALIGLSLHALLVVALVAVLVTLTTLALNARKPMEERVKKLDVLMEKAEQALDNVNAINFQQANSALNKIDSINFRAANKAFNQAGALGGLLG